MDRVLFLCSANYYRSRFAEHFFNWLAENHGMSCRADSRGLMVGHWGDIGPISKFTVEGLKTRGIALGDELRFPQQVTEADLAAADIIVATKEAEHRPLMTRLFPDWADKVEYWHVDDLDCAGPEQALPLLEEKVRELAARLANHQ